MKKVALKKLIGHWVWKSDQKIIIKFNRSRNLKKYWITGWPTKMYHLVNNVTAGIITMIDPILQKSSRCWKVKKEARVPLIIITFGLILSRMRHCHCNTRGFGGYWGAPAPQLDSNLPLKSSTTRNSWISNYTVLIKIDIINGSDHNGAHMAME